MHLPWRDVAPGAGPGISTSITAAESAELSKLAEGRDVLEIGSAYGYSAVLMALAGARSIMAIDPHQQLGSYPAMAANLGFYHVEKRVHIVQGLSGAVLPGLAEKFDLIFIDGDHQHGAVLADVRMALEHLAEGGILACHDYGEDTCPGVGWALDQMFPGGPSRLIDTLFVVET
jgi:predicted O-methyltransferase YrrM